MEISSRTPEGLPDRCPLCGNAAFIEPATQGDAPCPSCGVLRWLGRREPQDDADRALRRRFAVMLTELPQRMRDVLVRRGVDGASFAVIAEEMHTTPEAAKMLFARGVARLVKGG